MSDAIYKFRGALLVSHSLLGLLNVTWPFASLVIEKSRLRFSWKFLFLHKEYKIDFPEIVKIEFKRGIFSKSLRFIHISARAPRLIIFWTWNKRELLKVFAEGLSEKFERRKS